MKRLRVRREAFTGRDVVGRLTGRAEFRVVVADSSYLHIGSGDFTVKIGEDEELAKIVHGSRSLEEVLRYANQRVVSAGQLCMGLVKYSGVPCIPGSSIKGMVRSRLELINEPIGNTVDSCFRVVSTAPMTKRPSQGVHGWRHAWIWWDAPSQDRGLPCNPLSTGDYSVCKLCDIFGAPGISSRVFFGNACAKGDVRTVTKVLDHDECLELVPPGTVFSGEFSFINLSPEELGLVLIGMGAGSKGVFKDVLMGKSKYRVRRLAGGREIELGRVRYELVSLVLTSRLKRNLPRFFKEKCLSKGHMMICNEATIKDVVAHLVAEAVNAYPGFRRALTFSEVNVKYGIGGV